ncbi:MAG: orotate phosphoribosyltransferase [Euryarchaeota archaeon]|nr:orotate phosphoribosyltransferase [Euryarchaeota archaeon]
MNEVVGLCSICGKPGPLMSCMLCGSLTCNECFDTFNHVCKICSRKNQKRPHGVYSDL